MHRAARNCLALVALTLLAACASNRFAADVTRFHLAPSVARGSVFLVPMDPAAAGTLEFQSYASAVAAELGKVGFAVTDQRAAAELIGVVGAGQTTREGPPKSSPVSIGVGGGTFGRNVGIGVGTTFGVGKPKSSDIALNTLQLRLRRASDATVIWEGRAVAEAAMTSRYGPLASAVPALANALLRDFPGKSGQTVRVNL
jgi:hypothetical protein